MPKQSFVKQQLHHAILLDFTNLILQKMQTFGNLNKQNTLILPPPSKMKFSHTHIHFFHFISKYQIITASNKSLFQIFFHGQENKITLSELAKKLRDQQIAMNINIPEPINFKIWFLLSSNISWFKGFQENKISQVLHT